MSDRHRKGRKMTKEQEKQYALDSGMKSLRSQGQYRQGYNNFIIQKILEVKKVLRK